MSTFVAWIDGLSWAQRFGWVSFILSVLAYFPYDWKLFRRSGEPPKKATWLIIALVDAIIFSSMLIGGEFSLQMLAYTCGATSIFLFAMFWHGERGWTQTDKQVLAVAALAIVAIPFVGPVASIALSTVAVTIGSIPMWQALWRNPNSEPRFAWWVFWVGGLFGVLAIKEWTLVHALGPVSFFLFQTSVVVLGLLPRRRHA